MTCKAILNRRSDDYARVYEALKQHGKPATAYDIAEKTGLSAICCSNFLVHGFRQGQLDRTGLVKVKGVRRPLYVVRGAVGEVLKKSYTFKSNGSKFITEEDEAWMQYYRDRRAQRIQRVLSSRVV
jgi:DNA-binding transcriptional regulator GbsR (MarR family)